MRPRKAWHLLWTIPLALLVAVPLFFLGSISLCGVSGCGGGGFGPAYGPDYEWIVPYCLAALFVGLAVGLPAWGPKGFRLIIGGLVAFVVSLLLITSGFIAKYPTLD